MMKNLSVLLFLVLCTLCTKAQVRTEYLFEKGWKFTREDGTDFMKPGYDDARWQSVTIPHDWAIYGPFSIHNDQQKVAIVQDGQKGGIGHAGRTADCLLSELGGIVSGLKHLRLLPPIKLH